MSRSGYSDDWDGDQWVFIRWRGAVKSALRGRRGQAFLKEMLAALDALPERKLIAAELIAMQERISRRIGDGDDVCAIFTDCINALAAAEIAKELGSRENSA